MSLILPVLGSAFTGVNYMMYVFGSKLFSES